jgi:hypothetical protein
MIPDISLLPKLSAITDGNNAMQSPCVIPKTTATIKNTLSPLAFKTHKLDVNSMSKSASRNMTIRPM